MKPDTLHLLAISAQSVYRATLISGPEFTSRLFKEINEPNVGDLVMEITTFYTRKNHQDAIGRLLAIERRPIFETREQASEAGYEENEPIPTEKVWVLKLEFDDGREFTWRNAAFIKILEQPIR